MTSVSGLLSGKLTSAQQEMEERLRTIALQRYQLLSYWYTAFYESERTGMPTMRPLWVEYPSDPKTWAMDDQWLIGSNLLVKPVSKQGAHHADVYLPPGDDGAALWYLARDGTRFAGAPAAQRVDAPLGKIPVFQRGGSVVPRQMRLRRSSAAMRNDPYTLVVAADGSGGAHGELYMDAGDGYGYREGAYALRRYNFAQGVLSSLAIHDGAPSGFAPPNTLERVELMGVAMPERVELRVGSGQPMSLDFKYDEHTRRIVVRKPGVLLAADWTITLA